GWWAPAWRWRLALALGAVSWAAARGRGAAAGPVLQPAAAPGVVRPQQRRRRRRADEEAPGRFHGRTLSDMMRSSDMLRGTNPRDREKMVVGLEEQFSKTDNVDKGVQLTEAWILLGNWREAEATCQKLTNLYPHDPKPRLLPIVINVTRVMETLLSTDRTTTDNDIEEISNKINEMTKNAIIDAWKKYRKK
ncbi:hypothetical protein PVAP13_8NG044800, partial [Panicum virgatum]